MLVASLVGKVPLQILLDGPVTHIALKDRVLLFNLQNGSVLQVLQEETKSLTFLQTGEILVASWRDKCISGLRPAVVAKLAISIYNTCLSHNMLGMNEKRTYSTHI